MNEAQALKALSALAHEHRMAMVRALVAAGDGGIAACALADRRGISPSAASFHLSALEQAGLISGTRKGRHVYYTARSADLGALLAYLMNDCCGGDPDVCGCAIPAPHGQASG